MSETKISQVFPTVLDSTCSLRELARKAVGEENLYNISLDIPFETFNCAGGNSGIMLPRLAPCLCWKGIEKFARDLVAEGYILGNIGELVQFARHYPEEIEKYSAVFALDEDSRWLNTDNDICVAYARVRGSRRCFCRYRFDRFLNPEDAVIIFQQTEHRALTLAQVI
ncbi:MAG: hypothetical protein G01um101413_238 [Parcubacteria group bacterium Gr01-1014_13]|nr:MAG: hypothetical protein G01um101413_238 [Parcubacteria group bacterium Gr01-1014_13]